MKWSFFFTSVIGRKLVMALTGLFLITFLLVHVGLNACIFADWANPSENGEMFNKAAHFMGSTIITRILEIVLFAGFIIHIIQGYVIEAKNRAHRSQGYAKTWETGKHVDEPRMALLGTIIFLFLVVHISKFWWSSRITNDMDQVVYNNIEMHNVFLRMYDVFQNPLIVLLYLAGVTALGFHLWHGFHSGFRSMGVHNKKYLGLLKALGYGFTMLVSVGFALMPVSMYLDWVTPN